MWADLLLTVSCAIGSILVVRKLLDYTARKSETLRDWEHGRRDLMNRHNANKDAKYYERRGVVTETNYLENSRGVEIYTKRWLPLKGDIRGLVFYCHGYGDTCTYLFDDVAVFLAQKGFAVFGMDHEGHGLSSGLHGYIQRFDTLVDDVIETFSWVKGEEAFVGKPSFLYGESMGGAIALKIHRREPKLWEGAILLAPMCKIAEDMYPHWIVVEVLKFLARLYPTWKLVPTRDVCYYTFRVPEKRALGYNNPVKYEGKPRLGTAVELLKATDDIEAHLEQVTLPFLLLHGGADTVTDPSISKVLYEQAASKDKTLLLYEGSWHSLTGGEPDDVVARVLNDIFNWLDARCPVREESDFTREYEMVKDNGDDDEVSSPKSNGQRF